MRWIGGLLLLLLVTLGAAPAHAFTYSFNVANAPAWQASHSYTQTGHLGDRVLAGPGLTPGGSPSYTSGSNLYLLELTTFGTSGSSQPTISSCPSTGITDGSAIWQCLVKVDYITLSSPLWDDPVVWQPNVGTCTNDFNPQPGCYWQEQIVVNAGYAWRQCRWDGNVFQDCGAGGGGLGALAPPYKCVAASSGPGPTNPAHTVTDGTNCVWLAIAKIPYTADATHASAYPHQKQSAYPVTGTAGARAVIGIAATQMTITTWQGGFATQTYTGGVGDETNPIATMYHTAFVGGDAAPNCDNTLAQSMDTNACGFTADILAVKIVPAAGESFRDNLVSTDPLAIDQTKGVTLTGVSHTGITGCDGYTWADGLQIKSTGGTSPAYGDLAFCHNNGQFVTNSILDSDGPTVFSGDGAGISGNNLIINRSNVAGASGTFFKYYGQIYNTTYISLGSGANRTAHITSCGDVFGVKTTQNNNLYFGWANQVAIDTACFPTWSTSLTNNNATDLPNSTTNPSFTEAYLSESVVGQLFGGTSSLFSQNEAATFINPSTNLRLAAGSSARGVGVSYVQDPLRTNVKDVFNKTRSPTFDLGPAQFDAGLPPAIINTITLCSTSGSDVALNTPSPPMFPLEFKKGDIPAGQYPQLQATDGTPWGATFINIRHWADGSMKMAGVLPGPFPKAVLSEAHGCTSANVLNGNTIACSPSVSSPTSCPSGLTPTGLYAELIQMNIVGQGSGFGLTGSWAAKLANDANNVEVVNYGDGQGGRVYRILTHVEQSGTAHGQMEVYWYVQQLLNASGGTAGYRVLPRLTQPWYNHDTPAKDWRGLSTFNIQYGSGPTTITPPFPQAAHPVTVTASTWLGAGINAWTATIDSSYLDCGSASLQQCWITGYLTPNGGSSLPTNYSATHPYCAQIGTPLAGISQIQIVGCIGDSTPNNIDAGTGTFVWQPAPLLPHFGTLWGAQSNGRYTYIQGAGTVAADAPIIVKGNPTYDQSTGIFPPYDLSLSPTPDSNPATYPNTGGTVAWDVTAAGTVGANLNAPGERDEIGIRNAWCARWFYNRALIDEKYVRINGLVSGLFSNAVRDFSTRGPVHVGDPGKSYTGMPASLATTFQWASTYGQAGFTGPAHGGTALFFNNTDTSHMPDLAGCAYLATGEPQYLDLTMEWADQAIFTREIDNRNGTVGGTNFYGVATYTTDNLFRKMAWALRAQVDADAWWPDSDPAGTQIGTYLHDQERASTHLPVLSIPLETSWAATNCYWMPPGRGNWNTARGPWNYYYMVNVLIDAASADEDADAKTLLNCSATWMNHAYSVFNGDYSLWATGENPYDIGKDSNGDFVSATFSWASGTATITTASDANLFTGAVVDVTATGYTGTYTVTRTSPTTSTFPLALNPGSSAGGIFRLQAQLVTSDALFSSGYGIAPNTSIEYIGWQAGTPGSIAQVFADYSAFGGLTPGGQSWVPADGDKYIFPPISAGNSPVEPVPPGGLAVHTPYYLVNTHSGTISSSTSWSSGTLTLVTSSAHGLSNGAVVAMGINGNTSSALGGYLGTNLVCTVINTTNLTCPLASNPSFPAAVWGEWNTSQIAATDPTAGGAGTPLNLTNSGASTEAIGVVPKTPPPNYPVAFVNNDSYLANGRGAVNGMIACGVTGLGTIQSAANARLVGSMAYFGVGPIGTYFQSNPKNAMAASFGGATGCVGGSGPPPPPSTSVPISARAH